MGWFTRRAFEIWGGSCARLGEKGSKSMVWNFNLQGFNNGTALLSFSHMFVVFFLFWDLTTIPQKIPANENQLVIFLSALLCF